MTHSLFHAITRCMSTAYLMHCRSEPDDQLLYILPNALTAQSMAEGNQGGPKAPVPPCIMAVDSGTTQISLEIDDRCACAPRHQLLLFIVPDSV